MLEVINPKCTPTKGSKYSACIDLRASENIDIRIGQTVMIGLGVRMTDELLDEATKGFDLEWFKKRHYLQLMLRSSLGKKGLILPNGVGIIDMDYRDEIKMIIHNPIKDYDLIENGENTMSQIELDCAYISIKEGDRIGQIMVASHSTELFGINTDDERDGGFGSTGSK